MRLFSVARFRFLQCANQILRFSGSGQAYEHIARNTECRHLTRKDLIEAIVVPSGGENSAIARKTNRRKRAAIFGKTHHKFRRKMRCISRAAAVAANKQFVSCAQTLIDHIGSLRHLWFEAGKCAKSLRCRFNRIA